MTMLKTTGPKQGCFVLIPLEFSFYFFENMAQELQFFKNCEHIFDKTDLSSIYIWHSLWEG